FVIHNLFVQSLSYALNEPAMHLAFDEQRIDDVSTIVDCNVFGDFRLAGLLIDLDDAHMSAEGECEIRRLEKPRRIETWLHPRWKIAGHICGADRVGEVNGSAGVTRCDQLSGGNVDFVRSRCEQVSRNLFQLLFEIA